MKSLQLISLAAFCCLFSSPFVHGAFLVDDRSQLDWQTSAWSWLCREAGKDRSNQEIASNLVRDLSMSHYPNKFSIIIGNEKSDIGYLTNDEGLKTKIVIVTEDDTTTAPPPTSDPTSTTTSAPPTTTTEAPIPTIEVTNGTLCSKTMIAIRIDNQWPLKCDDNTAIDEDQLNLYLNLSLNIGIDMAADNILDTVKSTQGLGFDFKVVLAANNKSSAAIATSTPEGCSGKFEATQPLVGYFGFKSDAGTDPDDYQTLASKTLIEALAQNISTTNEVLAQKIIKALRERPGNNFDWVTSVFPYNDYDKMRFSTYFNNASDNNWQSNKYYAENIVGKNLLVSGIEGIADQFAKCMRPVDPAIFDPFVSSAVSSGQNNATLIMETVRDGAKLLGFEAEVIIVASGVPQFGVEPFTFVDCTYEYGNRAANTSVLFYGLPLA